MYLAPKPTFLFLFFIGILIFKGRIAQAQFDKNLCQKQKRHHFKMLSPQEQADTLEVLHYTIRIDSLNFESSFLKGNAALTAQIVVPQTDRLNLMLEGFYVDSVLLNGITTSFQYHSPFISIISSDTLSANDTVTIQVFYHGNPPEDPQGWGGFTFNGSYAFNMGVGFSVNPHNYGRAWFPCIDNFTDKATYDFYITTHALGMMARCNGVLISADTVAPDKVIWHWRMNQIIPTYLAGIAVAPYQVHQTVSHGIPVEIAAVGNDLSNTLQTMAKLDTAVNCFLNNFGPYPFDKIGYSTVPFNSGAMEHATNIHIGRAFMNGNLLYESLWVHELSHMWWGDLVTCKTAEDIWLNEGFASYFSFMFDEYVYGQERYYNDIRTNHRRVLQFAHVADSTYWPLNNVPHAFTYSNTVYEKGADVVHTFRKFLGDSLFSIGAKHYMQNLAFGNASSMDLRDQFQEATGVDLTDFFDGWVFEAGFPHFYVDSFVVESNANGNYLTKVYTRQRSLGNQHVYKMPILLNLSNELNLGKDTIILINQLTNMFEVETEFEPTHVILDREENVSDAGVEFEKVISTNGNHTMAETGVVLVSEGITDEPVTARVGLHFAKPDSTTLPTGIDKISDYRFWKVQFNSVDGVVLKGRFTFNGSTNEATGYLDNALLTQNEYYIRMLYRKGPGYDWQLASNFDLNVANNPNNKVGSVEIDSLLEGEYVLALANEALGVNEQILAYKELTIYPNPANDEVHVAIPESLLGSAVEVKTYDMLGRSLNLPQHTEEDNFVTLYTSELLQGIYMIELTGDLKVRYRTKLFIER